MELCKFQKCAVCSDIKYRNIFKYVFKRNFPDVYICSNAVYKIINHDGNYFIIKNLDQIKQGFNGRFYVIDYRNNYIFLSDTNFEVICNSKNNCTKEPYVFKI